MATHRITKNSAMWIIIILCILIANRLLVKGSDPPLTTLYPGRGNIKRPTQGPPVLPTPEMSNGARATRDRTATTVSPGSNKNMLKKFPNPARPLPKTLNNTEEGRMTESSSVNPTVTSDERTNARKLDFPTDVRDKDRLVKAIRTSNKERNKKREVLKPDAIPVDREWMLTAAAQVTGPSVEEPTRGMSANGREPTSSNVATEGSNPTGANVPTESTAHADTKTLTEETMSTSWTTFYPEVTKGKGKGKAKGLGKGKGKGKDMIGVTSSLVPVSAERTTRPNRESTTVTPSGSKGKGKGKDQEGSKSEEDEDDDDVTQRSYTTTGVTTEVHLPSPTSVSKTQITNYVETTMGSSNTKVTTTTEYRGHLTLTPPVTGFKTQTQKIKEATSLHYVTEWSYVTFSKPSRTRMPNQQTSPHVTSRSALDVTSSPSAADVSQTLPTSGKTTSTNEMVTRDSHVTTTVPVIQEQTSNPTILVTSTGLTEAAGKGKGKGRITNDPISDGTHSQPKSTQSTEFWQDLSTAQTTDHGNKDNNDQTTTHVTESVEGEKESTSKSPVEPRLNISTGVSYVTTTQNSASTLEPQTTHPVTQSTFSVDSSTSVQHQTTNKGSGEVGTTEATAKAIVTENVNTNTSIYNTSESNTGTTVLINQEVSQNTNMSGPTTEMTYTSPSANRSTVNGTTSAGTPTGQPGVLEPNATVEIPANTDDGHPCNSQPCQNNGTCIRLGQKNFECLCPFPYLGRRCETYVSLRLQTLSPAYEGQQAAYACYFVIIPFSMDGITYHWSTYNPDLENKLNWTNTDCLIDDKMRPCSYLWIDNLRINDTGVIECIGNPGVGGVYRVNTTTLRVLGYPRVNLELSVSEPVYAGDKFNLTCKTTIVTNGRPDGNVTTVTWWKDDKLIGRETIGYHFYNGTYTMEVLSAPEGTHSFGCVVNNTAGSGRDSKFIKVKARGDGVTTPSTGTIRTSFPTSNNETSTMSVHTSTTKDKPSTLETTDTAGETTTINSETTTKKGKTTTMDKEISTIEGGETTTYGKTTSAYLETTSAHPCGCKNGGVCSPNQPGGPNQRCDCLPGYCGSRCEHKMDAEVTAGFVPSAMSGYEGSIASFTCTFHLKSCDDGSARKFSWFHNGNLVDGGGKYDIRPVKLDVSQLSFELGPRDVGTVSCRVNFKDVEITSSDLPLLVLQKPSVRVEPMTTSLYQNEALNVSCTATLDRTGHREENTSFRFCWYKNNQLFKDCEEVTPVHTDGLIRNTKWFYLSSMNESSEYRCNVSNNAGTRSGKSVVTLIPPVSANQPKQACGSEEANGVKWRTTLRGTTAREQCPDGQIGVATRLCRDVAGQDAWWEEANINDCRDPEFYLMQIFAARILDGEGARNDSQVEGVLGELENITRLDPSSPNGMKPGNMHAAATAVAMIAKARLVYNGGRVTQPETQSVTRIMSTLLDIRNADSWRQLIGEDSRSGVNVVETSELYSQMFSGSIQMNQNITLLADNLVMNVKAANGSAGRDVSLPHPGNIVPGWSSNTVFVSKELLSEISGSSLSSRVSISNNMYQTAQTVFPSDSSAINVTDVRSVLTLSLGNTSLTNLLNPVQMSFTLDKVPARNESMKCGFWNIDAFNGTGGWDDYGCITTVNGSTIICSCNHTTNFAVLVTPNAVLNNFVLNLVSRIGTILSMVAVLVTMFVYLLLWKYLKSNSGMLLINLCIALATANGLFVFGVTQVEPKLGCMIIAAFLHYFFLASFCIMLAQGVYCLVSVVHVFHQWSKPELCGLVITGWSMPAIVVGVTLAVSGGSAYGTDRHCWLSVEGGYLYAFVGPMAAIIAINLIVLVIVIKKALGLKKNLNSRVKKIKSVMWNISVLLPLLGIMWIFGLLAMNTDPNVSIAFQWVFSISNSLQGVFIFVFHCLCNTKLREAIRAKVSVTWSTGSSSNRARRAGQYRVRTSRERGDGNSDPNQNSESSEGMQMSAGILLNPGQEPKLHRREKMELSSSSGALSDDYIPPVYAVTETTWKDICSDEARPRMHSFEIDLSQEVPLHRSKDQLENSFAYSISTSTDDAHDKSGGDSVDKARSDSLPEGASVIINDGRTTEVDTFVDANFSFLSAECHKIHGRDDLDSSISDSSIKTEFLSHTHNSIGTIENGYQFRIPRPSTYIPKDGLIKDEKDWGNHNYGYTHPQDEYF